MTTVLGVPERGPAPAGDGAGWQVDSAALFSAVGGRRDGAPLPPPVTPRDTGGWTGPVTPHGRPVHPPCVRATDGVPDRPSMTADVCLRRRRRRPRRPRRPRRSQLPMSAVLPTVHRPPPTASNIHRSAHRPPSTAPIVRRPPPAAHSFQCPPPSVHSPHCPPSTSLRSQLPMSTALRPQPPLSAVHRPPLTASNVHRPPPAARRPPPSVCPLVALSPLTGTGVGRVAIYLTRGRSAGRGRRCRHRCRSCSDGIDPSTDGEERALRVTEEGEHVLYDNQDVLSCHCCTYPLEG